MTILLGPAPAMDTMEVREELARTAEREAAENFLVVDLPLVNWVFTAEAAEAERAKDIWCGGCCGLACVCACATRVVARGESRNRVVQGFVVVIHRSGLKLLSWSKRGKI